MQRGDRRLVLLIGPIQMLGTLPRVICVGKVDIIDGSEVVDHMQDGSLFQEIMGPAGQQLSTQKNSKPNSLKPIPGTIGIIAGSVTSDPWFAWMFDSPNDGKVSVDSARLDEMADFLVVEHGHTFIMNHDDVIEQVLYFLKQGKFKVDRHGDRLYRERPPDSQEDVYRYK